MAVEWEHKADSCSESGRQALLDQRSAEGWELVSTHADYSGVRHGYDAHFDLFFKRRKVSE